MQLSSYCCLFMYSFRTGTLAVSMNATCDLLMTPEWLDTGFDQDHDVAVVGMQFAVDARAQRYDALVKVTDHIGFTRISS